jgi:hypothetical protein
MSSNSFDLITQEVLRQQKVMKILQAENRELHQQLTDLRSGRGICIEMNRKRFALSASCPSNVSDEQFLPLMAQEVSPIVAEETMVAIPRVLLAETAKSTSPSQNDKQPAIPSSTTFLEEAMISEFASAMDDVPQTHVQAPIGQQQEHKQEKREEEQLAKLRRDLMGSYLLD